MDVYVTYDERLCAMVLEARGGASKPARLIAVLEQVGELDALEADKLLVDLSGLSRDMKLDDVTEFLGIAPSIIEALGRFKVAVVLEDAYRVANVAWSSLFSMGVWLVIFRNRAQATEWLRATEERPTWLERPN